MRKLKLQVQMTLDGYVARPNGEMDWMTYPWTQDINNYVQELTDPVDTIVLGRKLAQGFIPHWAGVAADPDNPEVDLGKKFSETEKVVFTQSLKDSEWKNTVLAHGDLVEEITSLKRQEGGDIIAYGGAIFVSGLISQRLIDEFHIFINPVAIGSGMELFKEAGSKQDLELKKSTSFECGIVALHYEIKD